MQFFRLQNNFEKSLRKLSEDDRDRRSTRSRKGSEAESSWKTPRSEMQVKKAMYEPTLGMLQLLTYDPNVIEKKRQKMRLQSLGGPYEADVPIFLSTTSFESKLHGSAGYNPRNSGWGRRATESCVPSPSPKEEPVTSDVPLPQAPPVVPVSRQIINPKALAQLIESEASRYSTFTTATESPRWDETSGSVFMLNQTDVDEPVRQFSIASLHGSDGSEEFANIDDLTNPNYRYITIEDDDEEEEISKELDEVRMQESASKKNRFRDTFGMQDFIARQQAAAKEAENADYQDFAKFLALPNHTSKETYTMKVRTSSRTARAYSTDSTSPVSPTTLRNTTSFGSVLPRKKTTTNSSHNSRPSVTSIASNKSSLKSSLRSSRRQSVDSLRPTMPKRVTTFGPEPTSPSTSTSSTASTLVTSSDTISDTVDVKAELLNLEKMRKDQETIIAQATRVIEQIQRTEALILKQLEMHQKEQDKQSPDNVQVAQDEKTQDVGDKSPKDQECLKEHCEVGHEVHDDDTASKEETSELLTNKLPDGHRLTFWWDDEVDQTYEEEHHGQEMIHKAMSGESGGEIETVRPLFDYCI